MGMRFMGGTGMDDRPPTDWSVHMDDFQNYTAADWVITETGSGTRDISDVTDGVLLITNAAADNDLNSLQWSGATDSAVAEVWKWVSGKDLFFGCRVKLNEATENFFIAGLVITDTDTEGGITDGIFFRKDDGDANLDFVVTKDSATGGVVEAASTVAANTWMDLEFHYNGSDSYITAYKDGVPIASVPISYAPDNEELAVTFTIKNGTDAAKSLSIDWFKVAKLRG